jgi:hypothetical protein
MIINIRARNSIPGRRSKPVALRKTGVGKAAGWIGFVAAIVVVAEIKAILADKSNKNV